MREMTRIKRRSELSKRSMYVAWRRLVIDGCLSVPFTPLRRLEGTSNVSRRLIHAPPIHNQTYLSDSMHACLNVDEILRLIASELVGSRGNGTAVTLACCCKSFEDPVLDALWKRQVRLSPLLESLPGGVWEEDICIVSAPTICVPPFL